MMPGMEIPLVIVAGFIALATVIGFAVRTRRARCTRFFDQCRGIGSASKLTGEVFYVLVFLHRDRLDSGEMERSMRAFVEAQEYLANQAKLHGKHLSFKPLFHRPFKMRVNPVDQELLDDRIIRRLGRRFGRLFQPGPDMKKRSYFILAFSSQLASKQGKAVVAKDPARPPSHPEYCLCSPGSSPELIAHEILHLFGARDLTDRGPDDSIMHTVGQPLADLSVDPDNAYAVGWRDNLDG
jgi:hypothetical protein